MSDFSQPAVPMNGRVPADREYRILDDGHVEPGSEWAVEQWSEWAGMWDLAYHGASKADAQRFVREHTANETRPYRALLRSNMSPEMFIVDVYGTSVEDARNNATQPGSSVMLVVPAGDANKMVEDLADEYWRVRMAPGGTIVDDRERVHHSAEAAALWDKMGNVISEAADDNRAALARAGVPEPVAAIVDHKSLELTETSLRWQGHFPGCYELDKRVSPPLTDVPEWADSTYRWVWVDPDLRMILTYCEGDVSGARHFTNDAYEKAYTEADDYYKKAR